MRPRRSEGRAFALAGLLLSGCAPLPGSQPFVEFVRVPRADPGGATQMSVIEGRVTGAGAAQVIVLYARSGLWYVQPFADRPFTAIEPDATWKSTTHLGTEYAALLVDPEYKPAALLDTLPPRGGGVFAVASVQGEPPFWRTRWFQLSCVLAVVLLAWAVHLVRVRKLTAQLTRRFDERLADRTRLAQELYDTLLQGFLSASMQLHLAVDQLPEGSPERPGLERILRVMGKVTEEGRLVLQGLRSSEGETDRLGDSLSRIGHELGIPEGMAFRTRVQGEERRLHPIIRDEVYGIGREALVNALRHAQARGIDVDIEYSAKGLRMLVRDDGRGIDAAVLDGERTGERGLPGMRQRAERVGGRLRVRSSPGAGTEVELTIPGGIAFQAPLRRAASTEEAP